MIWYLYIVADAEQYERMHALVCVPLTTSHIHRLELTRRWTITGGWSAPIQLSYLSIFTHPLETLTVLEVHVHCTVRMQPHVEYDYMYSCTHAETKSNAGLAPTINYM